MKGCEEASKVFTLLGETRSFWAPKRFSAIEDNETPLPEEGIEGHIHGDPKIIMESLSHMSQHLSLAYRLCINPECAGNRISQGPPESQELHQRCLAVSNPTRSSPLIVFESMNVEVDNIEVPGWFHGQMLFKRYQSTWAYNGDSESATRPPSSLDDDF